MASEDAAVDVSILESLIEVRRQQELVDQLCERAEAMRERVATAVYDRVHTDYEARRQALDAEASPLVTRALAEYRRLRAQYDIVQGTHDAAALDRDEIEFRHSIGEIDEATRAGRLTDPERVIAETRAELARLDEQEARFREALPGVDLSAVLAEEPEAASDASPDAVPDTAPEAAADAAPMPAAAEPVEPPPAPPVEVASPPAAVATEAAAPDVDVEPVRQPADQQATVWLTEPIAAAAAVPAPAPVVEPPPLPAVAAHAGRGFAAPALQAVPAAPAVPPLPAAMPGPATEAGRAALVSEIDAGESVNYQLTGLTYIGRAEDNQIRILDPGISRRHVLITATATGYTIRDLKSQNGTYLNGERIDERLLADGDRITLGEVTLVFRRGAAPASVEREPGSAA